MSKIDKLNSRLATHVLSTRLDGRYLATLIRFWHQQGELPRSLSELIRLSVEEFTEFLILNGKIDFVQNLSDAEEIISSTGLSTKRTNPRNIAQVLVSEGAILTPKAPHIDSSHRRTVAKNPVATSGPEVSTAQALLEESLERDLKARIEAESQRTEDFKRHILNPEGSSDD